MIRYRSELSCRASSALGLVGAGILTALVAVGSASATMCGWNIVSSPNTNMPQNALASVAVVTADDIWAVGDASQQALNPGDALIEHWDGAAWSIIPSAPLGSAAALLDGVSADASNDVWAVGEVQNGGSTRTLTEHWNGRRWRVIPSPSLKTIESLPADNVLASVVAIAPDNVWAVGYAATVTIGETLIEHWDGSAWSIVPSPSPGQGMGFFDDRLSGVTAVSANDVWAAGESTTEEEHNLIEHWDGTAWSVISSPHFPNTNVDFMQSISAISSDDIWAVGAFAIPNAEGSPLQTATLHWDGATWNIVASPSPSPNFDVLNSVAAISANDVWAVGGYTTTPLVTLIEHWDGVSWTVVPSPTGRPESELTGAAAVSSNDVWSVGMNAGGGRTLIEHYTCQ